MNNNETIAQLFRQHYPDMMRLARLLLHDDAESEDAVGEVFSALMDKDILPTGSTARTFLMTAVRNRCLNQLRNRTIQQRLQRLYLLDSQISDNAKDMEERIGNVRHIIEHELDDTSRRVLTQRYDQQLSYAEIAKTESISETAVYKRIRKALDSLKEKLQNKQDHGQD
uniref:RNA polymerase sigma factor n=1 Tax=Prevotella sp. TaxID=59823 RepID=UPI0040274DEA